MKIRTILLDNNNWRNFYTKYKHLIRLSIVINFCKLLACGIAFLGFHHYTCQTSGNSKKVFHTCKSRFSSSCGKKSTEEWIANYIRF
ncbi:MAG: transposase zinc-binding domain-containing protein [Burkholderiales bacterium]|nr:transposase zinc-binding domain-containing protein [Burkholderiales bacterium]